MHIWILNHYAAPLDGSGATRHATLAKYLQTAGHRVTIFASAVPHGHHGSSVTIPDGASYTDRMYDGVRFRFVRTTPYANSMQRFVNMISFGRNVLHADAGLEYPDVIIGSSVHLHAANAAARLARRYAVPFIFEVRDIWPESLADVHALSRSHPLYWYLRRMEVQLYRRADQVIALHPGMMPYLQAHGVPADRAWYLPNGVDPVLYPEVSSPPSTPPFVISYLGAHGPVNGLETVIEAAALLQRDRRGSDILFRLVGDGPEKPLLQQKTERAGLTNIEFLEPVTKRELAAMAQRSHAFVYTHRYMPVVERYGLSANKLFDYLLAARPIIFSCASYNDPVGEAQAGMSIHPQDPTALAEAAIALRNLSSDDRARMGERGRTWVLAHHDLRKLTLLLEERLFSLLTPIATDASLIR